MAATNSATTATVSSSAAADGAVASSRSAAAAGGLSALELLLRAEPALLRYIAKHLAPTDIASLRQVSRSCQAALDAALAGLSCAWKVRLVVETLILVHLMDLFHPLTLSLHS